MSDNLEIKIIENMSSANSKIGQAISNLKKQGYEVDSLRKKYDNLGNVIKTTMSASKLSNPTTKLSSKTDFDEEGNIIELQDNTKKISKNLDKIFNIGKIYLFWNLTKGIRTTIKNSLMDAIDFVETTNKFSVAMGSATGQAVKFQYKLSEAFGTSISEMMNYQATFKNIMSGLGEITDIESEKISESLILMGLDYSSLYNVSQSSSMEKFQSALTGSIRPIRSDSGYDVSDLTISNKAKELGIDRTSKNLTQIEKRLLRIVVLMEQMKNTDAMNDLAKTIESPSNQLKVLQNQLEELRMWFGSLFIGTLGSVLPYINGFIMAIKEVVKTLAYFVGYTNDLTSGVDGFDVAESSTSNISDNLGSANSRAKELSKTLMGFDVLNVIKTPDKSGGGSTGMNYIDPKILAALGEYDSIMDNVRMKANDIRDSIMEWLGFTKDINGEWEWSSDTLMKNLVDWWKDLNTYGKIFVELGIALALYNMWRMGSKLLDIIGVKGLFKAIKNLITPSKDLIKAIFDEDSIKKGSKKWAEAKTTLDKWKSIGTGMAISVAGITILTDAFVDVQEEGFNANNVLKLLFGTIGLVSGAFVIGSTMAGIFGTAVGIATGGITIALGLLSSLLAGFALANMETQDSMDEIGEYEQKLENLKKAREDSLNASIGEIENTKELISEMDGLVDANGKVKSGYEDRVEYILTKVNDAFGTEYKLINGVITENGKQVESYGEVRNSIDEIIEKKKLEGIVNAYADEYNETIKRQVELKRQLKDVEDEHTKSIENGEFQTGQYEAAIKDIGEQYKDNKVKLEEYQKMQQTFTTGSIEDMKKLNDEYFGDSLDTINATRTEVEKASDVMTSNYRKNIDSISSVDATVNIKANTTEASGTLKTFFNKLSGKLNLAFGGSSIKNILGFAGGGMPSSGEMFLAREDGIPEFIGQFGNKTGVMNNNQIVEAVSAGVANAVSSVIGNSSNGGSYNFYFDDQKTNAVVTKRTNRENNIRGW